MLLTKLIWATLYCSLISTSKALSLPNSTAPYTSLSLPTPLNWKPSPDAGGGSVIETLYKPYNQYNASSWARFILAECESLAGGTCIGYSELTTGAYNTEQPYRIWWGIVYGAGAKLSLQDFRRDISENDQIQDTVAFVVREAGAGVGATSATNLTVMSTMGTSAPGSTQLSAGGAASSTSAGPGVSTGAADGRLQPYEQVRFGLVLLLGAALMR
ncbi:hypothetical protein M409DRAFT_26055 [Zasmidium cellare ATCC 36951]|uniref:Uncharacterized protein n=1 Tax=Zasmidium cellare ATCC 36951 TaxID=1080233 RepID=A0A6A6CC04_ZASCE|nr:uncharacterized protein M409DRAFT_26055 [Zasmidium cellare ATCC 36951]KAF2163442.1 hypothetical protein M409DRAFT_26055 [Zasmidium cellare ATCC 36951]